MTLAFIVATRCKFAGRLIQDCDFPGRLACRMQVRVWVIECIRSATDCNRPLRANRPIAESLGLCIYNAWDVGVRVSTQNQEWVVFKLCNLKPSCHIPWFVILTLCLIPGVTVYVLVKDGDKPWPTDSFADVISNWESWDSFTHRDFQDLKALYIELPTFK